MAASSPSPMARWRGSATRGRSSQATLCSARASDAGASERSHHERPRRYLVTRAPEPRGDVARPLGPPWARCGWSIPSSTRPAPWRSSNWPRSSAARSSISPPVAAYVPKTITVDARTGNRPPRILETPGGMINAIGLSGEGLEAFVRHRLSAPSAAALPADPQRGRVLAGGIRHAGRGSAGCPRSRSGRRLAGEGRARAQHLLSERAHRVRLDRQRPRGDRAGGGGRAGRYGPACSSPSSPRTSPTSAPSVGRPKRRARTPSPR